MRRLIATAFHLFRHALLSATLIVIGGTLMAVFAGSGPVPAGQPALAGLVLAALLLPGLLLPRAARRRRKPGGRRRAKRGLPARPRARSRPRPSPAGCPRDGHDFEIWVAGRLELHGWRAVVTAGSGDQGLDIIARQGGRRIGIQCKRYDGAVGNKAVQEAFSGRAFHRVDAAVVITTGHYTESAKALSRKTGVHLLHVRDIPRMGRLC
ncbi:restriction endonuclease [uncultured Paracoccus sp.]|uniref:restriction endonuclease n=1 Tax=uncultured Paracoccus sp. TaxID=189685 RepID=UPI0025D22971|nr:restriction endonuclease [uncultured Paracoccus sp.]